MTARRGRSTGTSAVDAHIGARIRARRTKLKISAAALAGRLGIAYQQLHKYERGENRISAGRLQQVAFALGSPIGWFFVGLPDPPKGDGADPLDKNLLAIARLLDACPPDVRAHACAMIREVSRG